MRERTSARRAHNLNQQQAFDAVAKYFDQPVPDEILQRLDRVVEAASIEPGEVVLDVGVGAGVLMSLILKRLPGRVLACDLSPEMLSRTKARFGERVTTVHSDVVDLPGDWGPVDVVFCNAMFGNVYDQTETVVAVSALLGPDGRLVISHPMGSGFVRRLKENSPQYQLKELPSDKALSAMLVGTDLALTGFTDSPDLYLAVCQKGAT